MHKTVWNSAGFNKALCEVEANGGIVFRTDRELELVYAHPPCMVADSIEKRSPDTGTSIGRARIDHDQRSAVRHLAHPLPHQTHQTGRHLFVEGRVDDIVSKPVLPFFNGQAFPVLGAAGIGLGIVAERFQPDPSECIDILTVVGLQDPYCPTPSDHADQIDCKVQSTIWLATVENARSSAFT